MFWNRTIRVVFRFNVSLSTLSCFISHPQHVVCTLQ
uniref:Uncharacterized protein n=1 Tax=Anopheles quadriannulatus TaxID=34691 RepID=A0A182XTF3_ANOQN